MRTDRAGDRGRIRRSRRRRIRRRRISATAAGFVLALGCGAVLLGMARGAGPDTGDRPADAAPRESSTAGTPPPRKPDPTTAAPTPSSSPPVTPKPKPKPKASRAPAPGTFVTAGGGAGRSYGSGGQVHTYRVEVESATGQDADAVAAEVGAVFGHRRGWTRPGTHSFRQVAKDSPQFTVKLATPATVDRICGAYGLLTRGEVNCSVGTTVVVNLKRWEQGSPQFSGSLAEYRALIVNHEVGHWLGHGHATCPGPGLPAPAMMQQIKGLRGCVSNAWPYAENGRYLDGPAVA